MPATQQTLTPLVEYKEWRGIDNLTTDPMRLLPGYVRVANNVDIDDERMAHRRDGVLRSILSGSWKSLWSKGDLCFGVKAGVLTKINVDWTETTILSAVGTTTMTTVESLVTENNQSATLRKVCDILLMTVNRLPTARFTAADITSETEITGIRADHQDGLVNGIAKWAFLKPDSNCLDLQSAERHRVAFEEFKVQVKRDLILLNKPDKSRKPRSGTSIWY